MTTITLEGKEYQLDIEKAKKLNLLKEKDDRVRSWEELKTKYKSNIVYSLSDALGLERYPGSIGSTRSQLTPYEAKALAAFSKLLKLRRDWIGEWEPDWTDYSTCKFVIGCVDDGIHVNTRNTSVRSLSFPTEQMAHEFLETFHDLIEEAKTLI